MKVTKHCPICLNNYIDRELDPENKELIALANMESPTKVCLTCKHHMEESIIFITYSQVINKEIVRSHGYFVLEEDGAKILLRDSPQDLEMALERRVLLISDQQAENFQLWKYAVEPNKAKNKAKEYYKSLKQDLVPGLDEEE